MTRDKKHHRKKPGGLPSLTPEHEGLLDSLLRDPEGIPGSDIRDRIQDPRVAEALIDRLPAGAPESLAVIMAVRESFPEKGVQKAIRKALFRLKQKGVALPDEPPRPGVSLPRGRNEQDAPEAYLGAIDGFGNRPVFVLRPHFPKGVDVGMGILNDETGIKEFLYGRYSRKRMKEVKSIFFERFSPMVVTSLSRAAAALERAYGGNQGTSDESVGEYLLMRPWILEMISLSDRPPVHDEPGGDAPSVEALTRSHAEKLLAHSFMESWIINPEEILPLMKEISEAEESPILINEGQKLARINEIKENAISRIFPDGKRALLKYRLEEMAYVFQKEEDAFLARVCLAAAASLNEDSTFLGPNPFLMGLVQRSLDIYSKMRAGTEGLNEPGVPSSGLILP